MLTGILQEPASKLVAQVDNPQLRPAALHPCCVQPERPKELKGEEAKYPENLGADPVWEAEISAKPGATLKVVRKFFPLGRAFFHQG